MRILVLVTCLLMSTAATSQVYLPKFDVQGHRGCRGLKPENSIPAFLTALDSGVTTLEMDVVITKDRQVLLSHEPWMSSEICSDPEGKPVAKKDSLKYSLYAMTYEQVKAWDCGSRGNERFPEQEKMATHKPLLKDVIVAVENHIKNHTKYEVDYNIEIKSLPPGDDKFHPKPPDFSKLVYDLVDQYLPMNRVVIQSFDFRVLKYWKTQYPTVRLAALVENKKSLDENLKLLGFTPSIYSPYYKFVDEAMIKRCRELKMRLIPWTVNDEREMLSLKGMGVDGIITDYPDRARKYKLTLQIERKTK
ncbi:MAG: glycerophosphodiester phosphodiesterase [Cyclobacteriaceae bacterium]|nr:glycerophosphodiester phosphodiesterase [Cyclobacteriaceae bacterium]